MSKKTIFKCDKCGNEQETDDQFWRVGITAINGSSFCSTKYEVKCIDVCRPCLESFGIHVQKPKDPTIETQKPPTVEELIRQIMQMVGIQGA